MALTNPESKTEMNAEIDSLGDKFDSLLRASSTPGTHFQFNVEKRWDDSKNVTIPSHFVLNLEPVSENLSQIPFFQRTQINPPLLENDSSMKATAVSYGSRRTKDSIAKCLENASNDCIPEKPHVANKAPENIALNDWLQSVSNTLENDESDDWLDNMLDNHRREGDASEDWLENMLDNHRREVDALDDWLDDVLAD